MKKAAIFAVAAAFILSLAACGSRDDGNRDTNNNGVGQNTTGDRDPNGTTANDGITNGSTSSDNGTDVGRNAGNDARSRSSLGNDVRWRTCGTTDAMPWTTRPGARPTTPAFSRCWTTPGSTMWTACRTAVSGDNTCVDPPDSLRRKKPETGEHAPVSGLFLPFYFCPSS